MPTRSTASAPPTSALSPRSRAITRSTGVPAGGAAGAAGAAAATAAHSSSSRRRSGPRSSLIGHACTRQHWSEQKKPPRCLYPRHIAQQRFAWHKRHGVRGDAAGAAGAAVYVRGLSAVSAARASQYSTMIFVKIETLQTCGRSCCCYIVVICRAVSKIAWPCSPCSVAASTPCSCSDAAPRTSHYPTLTTNHH